MKKVFIVPIAFTLSYTLYLQAQADVTHAVVYRCPHVKEITYDSNGKPQADTFVNGVYLHWVDDSIPAHYKQKAAYFSAAFMDKNYTSGPMYSVGCMYDDQLNETLSLRMSSNQLLAIKGDGDNWATYSGGQGIGCYNPKAPDQCKFLLKT